MRYILHLIFFSCFLLVGAIPIPFAYMSSKTPKVLKWKQTISYNTGSDTLLLTDFGSSIGMSSDGNWMIVGAYTTPCPSGSAGNGAVAFYKRVSGTWTWLSNYCAGATGVNFGQSVAISPDGLYAVVGEPGYPQSGQGSSGRAHWFSRSGDTWSYVKANYQIGGVLANAQFGYSVAITSNYTAVGIPGGQVAGITSGTAYLFTRNGADPTGGGITELEPGVGIREASGNYGGYVALSDGAAPFFIASAINEDGGGLSNAGKAHAYLYGGAGWNANGNTVLESNISSASGNFSGNSVSLSAAGTAAAIAAYREDMPTTNSGIVHVIENGGTNSTWAGWRQQLRSPYTDTTGGNCRHASISGNGLVVIVVCSGENSITGAVPTAGRFYVHTRAALSTNFTLAYTFESKTPQNSEFCKASAINSDGTVIAVGCSFYDWNGFTDNGIVEIYSTD